MEKLLLQPTYESEFAPQSAEFTDYAETISVENEKLLPTGFDFAKWLVEMDMDNIYKFPENFSFHVHSANPVGKANIEGYLNNYLKSR